MVDTPRTDEEVEVAKKFPATSHGLWVSAGFARDLERQLIDALDDVKRLHAEKMKFFERVIELERAVRPEVGALDPKGIERLQRIRDYAYQLQNRLDNRPARFNMDYTRARLSALCWAIERISGQPFDAQGGTSAPSPLDAPFAASHRTSTEEKP